MPAKGTKRGEAVAIVIVIIIVVTLAVLVAVSSRLFSVERVETKQDSTFDLPDSGGETGNQEDGATDGSGKKAELVDVFDYFSGDGEDGAQGENQSGDDFDSESISATGSSDAVGGEVATDKLTDLKSGRTYLVDCKKALETARDEGHIYCVCYFDYDRFSYINSLKGALTGDYVLTHTAQHVQRIFPDGTLVTRVSCDHLWRCFRLWI